MTKEKKNLIIIVIVLIALTLIAVSFKRTDSDSYKIGAALALTGDASPWGEESLDAANLAVDEINTAGGVNGKKLELKVEDMKSSSKDSVTAVSKLLNVDKANAIMITWLDSYPGSEAIVPTNMPLISQDAAIETVNTPIDHPNVFSLWYRTSAKAQVTMKAISGSGAKNVYIVLQHDPYYTKLAEFLESEASSEGLQIVGKEFINPGDDSRSVIAKIIAAKPDAIFFGSYDDRLSVDFLKRYSEQVKGTQLFGDEFIEQDLASKSFNAAWLEGIKYYVPADPDPVFVEKFEKRFGHSPRFSAGTTYDTVHVLAKYLTDRPANLSAYMTTQRFDTMTYGSVTFDSIGGIVADKTAITEKQIRNGTITTIKVTENGKAEEIKT